MADSLFGLNDETVQKLKKVREGLGLLNDLGFLKAGTVPQRMVFEMFDAVGDILGKQPLCRKAPSDEKLLGGLAFLEFFNALTKKVETAEEKLLRRNEIAWQYLLAEVVRDKRYTFNFADPETRQKIRQTSELIGVSFSEAMDFAQRLMAEAKLKAEGQSPDSK